MYLISAYFDDYTNKILSRYIEKIADFTGNKFMTDNHVPPHITRGKKLTKEQMQIAFTLMQESFMPFQGKITSIGLAKTNPHEDILTIELES